MPQKRKLSVVKASMAKTFESRRRMQVEGAPIVDIRKRYPFLLSKSGLLDKFERIMEYNLEMRFFEEVDRLAPTIRSAT